MSFLDSLENSVNAMERREEKDPETLRWERERKEAERNEAVLRGPNVAKLKNSAFTGELLTQCRTIGHARRVLVRFSWIGDNLRLDAGPKRLELVATGSGIDAVYSENGTETRREPVDFDAGDPAVFAKNWLES